MTRDDFIGRYVGKQVNKDEPIALESTLTGPQFKANPGRAIVWISLSDWPASDIATLDVQQRVGACNIGGDPTCHGPYVVQAIACETKGSNKAGETNDANKASETTNWSKMICSAAIAVSTGERDQLCRST